MANAITKPRFFVRPMLLSILMPEKPGLPYLHYG